MVYQATKQIAAAMDEKKLNYRIEESDNASMLLAKLAGKNAKDLIIRFISAGEGNDVFIRIFAIADGSKGDKNKIYALLNKLNADFRYICFYMAENGEINASYDIPLSVNTDLGPACLEILMRLWNIIDESYPAILAAVL